MAWAEAKYSEAIYEPWHLGGPHGPRPCTICLERKDRVSRSSELKDKAALFPEKGIVVPEPPEWDGEIHEAVVFTFGRKRKMETVKYHCAIHVGDDN